MQGIFYAPLEKCGHKVWFLIMLQAGEKKNMNKIFHLFHIHFGPINTDQFLYRR